MRRLLMIMLGMLVISSQLLAQNRTITGRVTDDAGKPLPNVSVQVKGQNIGTTTNEQGQYSLTVPSSASVLVFTSVGASPREVNIGSSNTINASLTITDASMEEVVVVGYGTGRKVGNTTGAIARVDGTVLQDKPTANAFDALQGKVAGLQVYTSSGEPSQTSSIRLHGVGSLGASSTPLYVMDGIPIDPGTVISLNPNDFESISVLKDASATSIYGSRAANGVIYITTKQGSPNRPATITLQTQYGVSKLANTDFFESVMNREELAAFLVELNPNYATTMNNTLNLYKADTRWYKVYYDQNDIMYQADLSVTGGGGRTSYYISGGYLNQSGLAYRSGFHRYTLRSNLTSNVNNWAKVGLNLFLGTDERQTNPYGSNNLNRGLGLLLQPWFSPVDANGNDIYGLIPGLGLNHPKYLADKIYSTSQNAQFNPSMYIQLTPIRGLTLKSQGGMEAYDFTTVGGTLPSYNNLYNGVSRESFTRGVMRILTNTGEYRFNVSGDHNFAALVGQEYIDEVTRSFGAAMSGLTDDRLILLSNGTQPPSGETPSASKSDYSYLSYFTRLEYNFRNRYFLDGSFRQDQSSRFGADNKTANFWSVGAMWKIKQEEFLAGVNWLTDLNIKASYGTAGNSAIGNYESQALVGTTQYEGGGGWVISSPGNPLLGWEEQNKLTVGTNFSLWNRLRGEIYYYDRRTENMLISVPYPYTSGFANIRTNVGSLKNSGIDVQLDGDVVRTRDAYVTPYVVLNHNTQEVTSLFQGKQYWIIPNTGVSWVVGQPVSYFYPIFKGVNPQTGNPEWYQPNTKPEEIVFTRKDPSAVTSTFSTAALQQNTGIKRNAPFTGGFGLKSGFKGFFMNADFSFAQGKYMINNDRYFFENANVFFGYNQSRTVKNYWKQPGDNAMFPRKQVQFTQFDSRLIEDASFMRLKSFQVGYQMPQSLMNKTGFMKGAKFYVTGRNLFTWTKYTGPDPEVDSNIGLGTNPNTKQVAVGLDLTF